jgi:hypothetical protein
LSFAGKVCDLIFGDAILRLVQQVEGDQRLTDRYGVAVAPPVADTVIEVNRDAACPVEVSGWRTLPALISVW